VDILKDKLKLLETLQELEIATSLLKAADGDDSNAVDQSYKKLCTDIVPLEKGTDLYKRLEQYNLCL
jgi:hypothetical protein